MKTIGVLFGEEPDWLKGKLTKKTKITHKSYGLFTRIGRLKGFEVIISSIDYYNKGRLRKAYRYNKGKYEIIRNQDVDIIFDRFWNSGGVKIKKNIQRYVKIFNHPELNGICWDKYICSKIFDKYMNRSFLADNKKERKDALKKIKSKKIVIKPRYGIMGNEVIVMTKKKMPDFKKDCIIQGFIDSSKGIKFLGIKGVHDLRIVTLSGKIDHAYVRRPRKGLITNIAQGGYVTHIDNKRLPKEVTSIVRNIDKRMERYGPRLYTVDMMFDEKGKPIVTELESDPVIDSAYKSARSKKIQRRFINHIFDAIATL